MMDGELVPAKCCMMSSKLKRGALALPVALMVWLLPVVSHCH